MLKRLKRTKEPVVDFCERCGSVCDSACRRNAVVERERERAFLHRMRVS